MLRVSPSVGVDEAIWKAEEALTLLRAGLPRAESDLLPWMSDPDEPETRQAVQRIEEPLRRLTDELFWFDLDRDADGDLLRRALVTLEPAVLNEYLDCCLHDGLSHRPIVKLALDGVLQVSTNGVPASDGACESDEPAPPDKTPAIETAGVPRLLNHARFRLLLAALSLYDALPDGVSVPDADDADPADAVSSRFEWVQWRDLDIAENPHELDLTGGRHGLRTRRTVALWSDALARWIRLTSAPEFRAFVLENIARLNDEVVGEDDAETIVNSASTRMTDLLVAEVKAQLLVGRMDGVRALLEVAAASDIASRRWSMAFRPLRPLLRTEAAELEPLLPTEDDPRFGDAELYLSRLKTLKTRWGALDPTGQLGLTEVGDEAVLKACGALTHMETYTAVDRLKPLYAMAMSLSAADSLKERIATIVTRLNGYEHYTCHFCKSREMELQRSIVILGKKESHRTYGFNSTTIHYMIKANTVARCARCCDLHDYIWDAGNATRGALGIASAAAFGYLIWRRPFGDNVEPLAYIILAGIMAGVVWASGIIARWMAAILATPKGERRYWKVTAAKQHQEMRTEGCSITIDYRRNAFQAFKDKQDQQG